MSEIFRLLALVYVGRDEVGLREALIGESHHLIRMYEGLERQHRSFFSVTKQSDFAQKINQLTN